jgi:hypothetical protein
LNKRYRNNPATALVNLKINRFISPAGEVREFIIESLNPDTRRLEKNGRDQELAISV